ncbi:MAG: type I-A CRISPR-associated protein Cas7/Csa2 [Candidatus Methanomethylicia archaeon]
MGEVFLSIRGRVSLNVEALNMTESIGNYVKHRRVPVMLPEESGYSIFYVPAISGESIAHGFQEVLAEISIAHSLPVCSLCSKGIFLKSTNNNVFKSAFNTNGVPGDNYELEKTVIERCVVEDIGGFLFAEGGRSVKRTSNFYTGYMIPVAESLRAVVIEPQLHSRYALGTPFVKERGQMIYYVELSSATYTFSFDVDTKYVGKTTYVYEHVGETVASNRKIRLGIFLDALQRFILEFAFGAKKTRFMPVMDWESIVLAVSDDVWTVPGSFSRNYIEKCRSKMANVSYNTSLYVYDGSGSFEEVVINAINDARRRLELLEGR